MGEESEGTYRALPNLDDDIIDYLLVESDDRTTLLSELSALLTDLGAALRRVDEEMGGLAEANAGLARMVQAGVEGLYGVFGQVVGGEQDKVLLRLIAYYNAILLLRALDLQWRRLQTP